MRLYGMYFVCKNYIDCVRKMQIGNKIVGGNNVRYIEGWKEKSQVLNELAKIDPLREKVRKLYDVVPVMYRDLDKFDLTSQTSDEFIKAREMLIVAMDTIIKLYETVNLNKESEKAIGFDVKLPKFQEVGEFSKCLGDLDFVIKQCPYLNQQESEIKYGSIDVGSTWLTFFIIGSAATLLLNNLSRIVDSAVKIKSHFTTVKMQEEVLRSIEIKNEIASEVMNAFKQVNDALTDKCIAELKQELGELQDGEEVDKTRRSLEKLSYWMDKGMQIYSSIDAPAEVKDLFPEQAEIAYLSDDLQKLIEMKEKEN